MVCFSKNLPFVVFFFVMGERACRIFDPHVQLFGWKMNTSHLCTDFSLSTDLTAIKQRIPGFLSFAVSSIPSFEK